MIRDLSLNTLRFVVLMFVQLAIINNIHISGFINPYVYVYFILLLPFGTPGWLLLALSFLTGFTVDIFSHTLGFHTAACVLMGFARPTVLRFISPREEYQRDTTPGSSKYGIAWFLRYVVALVLIHHFLLFYLEIFRLADFFQTFLRVILSAFFSVLLILLSEYIFNTR